MPTVKVSVSTDGTVEYENWSATSGTNYTIASIWTSFASGNVPSGATFSRTAISNCATINGVSKSSYSSTTSPSSDNTTVSFTDSSVGSGIGYITFYYTMPATYSIYVRTYTGTVNNWTLYDWVEIEDEAEGTYTIQSVYSVAVALGLSIPDTEHTGTTGTDYTGSGTRDPSLDTSTITVDGADSYAHFYYAPGASHKAYIYTNNTWKSATPYIYNGSSWVEATEYIYSGGWQ